MEMLQGALGLRAPHAFFWNFNFAKTVMLGSKCRHSFAGAKVNIQVQI
jgi:hypothetical protein